MKFYWKTSENFIDFHLVRLCASCNIYLKSEDVQDGNPTPIAPQLACNASKMDFHPARIRASWIYNFGNHRRAGWKSSLNALLDNWGAIGDGFPACVNMRQRDLQLWKS